MKLSRAKTALIGVLGVVVMALAISNWSSRERRVDDAIISTAAERSRAETEAAPPAPEDLPPHGGFGQTHAGHSRGAARQP